jgi:hypothetical protein
MFIALAPDVILRPGLTATAVRAIVGRAVRI